MHDLTLNIILNDNDFELLKELAENEELTPVEYLETYIQNNIEKIFYDEEDWDDEDREEDWDDEED